MLARDSAGAIATASYTVYLLAENKEEPTVQTLLSYDVTNKNGEVISDVPYRRDCGLACLEGESGNSRILGHYRQYACINVSQLCALMDAVV